ncbi:MAG: histone deacetylase [Candidatus Pelagibacter sp. TMED273]|nr:MAG: histone deacetylase [Candidatus Pelagibacter sp. TMED273]|tara:strand:- start:267 stop:1160 length:894 start_codon:yes stop_codon:yes gene_type:complete
MQLPIVNHPDYVAKINDDNKFPIKKFGALADHLLKTKVIKKFHIPKECSIETLKTSHSIEYIYQIKNKTLDVKSQKKIGFPINDSVVRRSFVATGGTVLASKLALDSKLACNTAGGSHHATFDFGAGYCVFNDVAVAANYLKNKGYAKKILILDLDVHQGNGNSEIFKNDKDVFTFSMHCASNYPAKKSKSDLDIELEEHMQDIEYMNILNYNLKRLNKLNFDFIFYIAGVDVHFDDRLGKLNLTDEGIEKRDKIVIENYFIKKVPLCGVLGGGYNRNFNKLVELHSKLHKSCADFI